MIVHLIAGFQEGTQCTKCKSEWALKTAIGLLYVLCIFLTIAVAILGYKGNILYSTYTASFFAFGYS